MPYIHTKPGRVLVPKHLCRENSMYEKRFSYRIKSVFSALLLPIPLPPSWEPAPRETLCIPLIRMGKPRVRSPTKIPAGEKNHISILKLYHARLGLAAKKPFHCLKKTARPE